MDWNDLRDFLAISRHRTLSAAADALGVQQSTMGRRLKALEARVGAKLLSRTPAGFVLTAAGEAILDNVARIEIETQAIERAITGKDARLEGVVRLAAIEDLAVEVLTPILADFQALYPGIALEFISDRRLLDLRRGDADIALRLDRFTQHDLAIRKIADFAFAAYASPDYLMARGTPDFDQGAAEHRLLLPPEAMCEAPPVRWFVSLSAAGKVALRASSLAMLVAAAEAGMGIACLPRLRGDRANLRLLDTPSTAPCCELWLGVHGDVRDVPRFRVTTEFITQGLRQLSGRLNPQLVLAK